MTDPSQTINTGNGDMVGRDKIVQGDEVHGDKVAGNKNIFQNIYNFFAGDTEAQRALRNRQNMLRLVWNTWIEGVLKKSLHNEVLIELGMKTKPDAVEHPWDTVMQMPDRKPEMVKPGTTMLELFDQSNGSLLILGEPGAGKTTMLLELAKLAILRAQENLAQPIPVVFNLSSWKPGQEKRSHKERSSGDAFADWLVNELYGKYYVSPKIGRPWIEKDTLLLFLDGLDEVKVENREACVQAINAFQAEHSMPLAVCSREQEYDTLAVHLKLCGAVRIQALNAKQVDEYLHKAGAGLAVVRQALMQDAELREFAQTPLILSILVLAYRDASFIDFQSLATTVSYRQRLFESYITQMFKRRGVDHYFSPEKTCAWLAWLTHKMIAHSQSLFYIEDIQTSWLSFSTTKRGLIYGMIGGLVGGLIIGLIGGLSGGPFFGLIGGLSGWLIGGLIGGLNSWQNHDIRPTEKLIWSWQGAKNGLIVGTVYGMIGGLVGGLIFGLDSELRYWLIGSLGEISNFGLNFGLIYGLIGLLIGGLSGGLNSWQNHDIKPTGKLIWSWQGMQSGLIGSLIFGLNVGLIGGLNDGLIFGLSAGLVGGLIGILIGVLISVLIGWQNHDIRPTEKLIWSWQGAKNGLVVGLIAGLVIGLIFGLVSALVSNLVVGLVFDLREGLSITLISGMIGGLVGGLKGSVIENRNRPGAGIQASLKNFVIGGLIGWLSGGLSGVLIVVLIGGLFGGLIDGLSVVLIGGLVGGLIGGLMYGGDFLIAHFISHFLLSCSGHLPWNIIPFLNYCTDRIFLRKVGGGYIFIHRMLMEHFAEMDDEMIQAVAQTTATRCRPPIAQREKYTGNSFTKKFFSVLIGFSVIIACFASVIVVPEVRQLLGLEGGDFSYQVHVQKDGTSEIVKDAKVIIEVIGNAPLVGYTDSNGYARIFVSDSYAGKPGRLRVEATGYESYWKEMDISKGTLPDFVYLMPLP